MNGKLIMALSIQGTADTSRGLLSNTIPVAPLFGANPNCHFFISDLLAWQSIDNRAFSAAKWTHGDSPRKPDSGTKSQRLVVSLRARVPTKPTVYHFERWSFESWN